MKSRGHSVLIFTSVWPMSTIRMGIARKRRTGTKTRNPSYHPMWIQKYWKGIAQYAQRRTRQSARRVGMSERYSLSAR